MAKYDYMNDPDEQKKLMIRNKYENNAMAGMPGKGKRTVLKNNDGSYTDLSRGSGAMPGRSNAEEE